jgi:hypothetical protein
MNHQPRDFRVSDSGRPIRALYVHQSSTENLTCADPDVLTDLPAAVPVTAGEIAILRGFLAKEIAALLDTSNGAVA